MTTDEEIKEAEKKAKLRKIKIESQLNAVNAYVEYVSGRVTGVGAITYGMCEILSPHLIAYDTPHPEYVLGGGVALIVGKSVLGIVKKVVDALGKTSL